MQAPQLVTPTDTAVVVIGRNEGKRLIICLQSCSLDGHLVVYVDSASTDDSVSAARQLGCTVVELDMSTPFSAARARNEGLQAALKINPNLTFVQFVDGDCELMPLWLHEARQHLETHAEVVAVCGRLKERHPEHSIYNLMCDIEWNSPPGNVRSVGGIAMFRVSALQEVGGFRQDVVAGEEPELCIRLRAKGGRIHKLPAQMALHDAAILRFKAWWTRTKRGGYAYALGHHLHGAPPEKHWAHETRRAVVWGALLPLATLLGGAFHPLVWCLAAAYPLQMARMSTKYPNFPWLSRLQLGFLSVVGKFAEVQGCLRFWLERSQKRERTIIEYK